MLIPRALVQSRGLLAPHLASGAAATLHRGGPHLGQKRQHHREGDDAALPAPARGEKVHQLDVSGQGSTVRLGELGPLVVNVDGTTGRVANWAEMTAMEKETTMRLLSKRNKARLEALKAKDKGESTGA